MHNCEIFSIRKSKKDLEALERDFQKVVDSLGDQGCDVRFKTEVSADPKKLSTAVMTSIKEGSADIFLFANALNTSDASSFKELFYEFISSAESELNPDNEHEGMIPKIKVFSLGDMGCGYRGYCFFYDGRLFVAVPYASLTQEKTSILLCEAVAKAQEVMREKEQEFPGGITYLSSDEKPKKENFFMSFIPHKGDTASDKVRKIIVLAAIAVFCAALYIVIDFTILSPMRNQETIAEIQQIAETPDDGTGETNADGTPAREQNWNALLKANKEIVGWIKLDGTPINYPVLWHKADDVYEQYYLKHTYKGDYSDYGSIFVDYRCKKGTKGRDIILHGHNMLDGSMFHELVNYSDGFNPKLDYYKKHSVLTFNTPEEDSKWKVISVFKTSTLYAHGEFFNYMQGSFNSDAEYMNFIYNLRIRSMFNTPVTVNETDQILILSTCSYEFTSFRTVLVARKVRPGEDDKVDVNLASVNKNPLYPDVYYQSNGGTRPDPLTFKTANAKGLVSWYDGKGELDGSEDLTATLAANPTEPPPTEPNTDPSASATTPPATERPVYYLVTYRNWDQKQIEAFTVLKGSPIPVPKTVPKYEDDYYYYVFDHWRYEDDKKLDIYAVNKNCTIYPEYKAVKKNKK